MKNNKKNFYLIKKMAYLCKYKSYNYFKERKKYARDGDRTHAHIRELDLKSNALTTRPPGLTNIYYEFIIDNLVFQYLIV
jgi:hypothetical protein